MSKKIELSGVEIPYITHGWFKKFFPKTSRYLEFILPLRHPNKINAYKFKLPDIKVYIVYGMADYLNERVFANEKKKLSKFAGLFVKDYEIIFIDLKEIQKYGVGPINTFKLEDFSNSFLKKILRYFDSITKYRTIIIHEYEHYMQSKYSIEISSRDSIVAKSIANFTQMDCEPLAKELLNEFETKSEKKMYKKLVNYFMSPREVEARLSQWIFFLIKGHSFESIRSLEKIIFGKNYYSEDPNEAFMRVNSILNETKRKIKTLEKEIIILRKKQNHYRNKGMIKEFSEIEREVAIKSDELFKTKRDVEVLENKADRLKVAALYFNKAAEEALRIANLFKKKYGKLSNII